MARILNDDDRTLNLIELEKIRDAPVRLLISADILTLTIDNAMAFDSGDNNNNADNDDKNPTPFKPIDHFCVLLSLSPIASNHPPAQ